MTVTLWPRLRSACIEIREESNRCLNLIIVMILMMMMIMMMMIMMMINGIKLLPEFAFLKLVVADRNISKVLFLGT